VGILIFENGLLHVAELGKRGEKFPPFKDAHPSYWLQVTRSKVEGMDLTAPQQITPEGTGTYTERPPL